MWCFVLHSGWRDRHWKELIYVDSERRGVGDHRLPHAIVVLLKDAQIFVATGEHDVGEATCGWPVDEDAAAFVVAERRIGENYFGCVEPDQAVADGFRLRCDLVGFEHGHGGGDGVGDVDATNDEAFG